MFVRVHMAPIEVKKAYRYVLFWTSPYATICVVLMALYQQSVGLLCLLRLPVFPWTTSWEDNRKDESVFD